MSLDEIEKIESSLADFVISRSLVFSGKKEDLPLDKSLVESGILDSYEMVELLHFAETNWKIQFVRAELTREKLGSIKKLSQLISSKISSNQ